MLGLALCASLSAGLLSGCASDAIGGYTPVSEDDIEAVFDSGNADNTDGVDNSVDKVMEFADEIAPQSFSTDVVSEVDLSELEAENDDVASAVERISSISSTDDPNVFFAMAAPEINAASDGSAAYMLRIDVSTGKVTEVSQFDAPEGYVERVSDADKTGSTTTMQLLRGWSLAQLLTFDDKVNRVVRSDDMWAALGGAGVAGAHINDNQDGFDQSTKTLPVVSSEPYVGLCALELNDSDSALRNKVRDSRDTLQSEDQVENVNSAVATASLLASSGMPAISVLDPVTLDEISTLVLRTAIDTRQVGLVDTVGMARNVGADVFEPDENRNPIQDKPVTSAVKTGLVAGVSDIACVDSGVVNHWDFAVSKRNDPAVLGLVDEDIRTSFIRDIIADGNAGDPSLDVAHFNGISGKNHLVVIDSRLGTVTGVVAFSDVADGEKVIAFDVVTGGSEPLIRYVVANDKGAPVRIVDAQVY